MTFRVYMEAVDNGRIALKEGWLEDGNNSPTTYSYRTPDKKDAMKFGYYYVAEAFAKEANSLGYPCEVKPSKKKAFRKLLKNSFVDRAEFSQRKRTKEKFPEYVREYFQKLVEEYDGGIKEFKKYILAKIEKSILNKQVYPIYIEEIIDEIKNSPL